MRCAVACCKLAVIDGSERTGIGGLDSESQEEMDVADGAMVRAAAVQMDVRLGDNAGNRERVLEKLGTAAGDGAELVVFPECSNSGYCFDSLDEARPYAESAEGDLGKQFASRCRELGVTGIVGFLEDAAGTLHNTALIACPDGLTSLYRKTHLPTLGIDRFLEPGNSLPSFDVPHARIGILICYDIRFPEAPRAIGLQGIDILAVPTNWPEGAESSPGFITRARAWESRVYVVAANRVGVERGRSFIGRSQIVSPTGEILVEASHTDEEILYWDLDLTVARQKAIVYEPGEWELDITSDRRPDLYGILGDRTTD